MRSQFTKGLPYTMTSMFVPPAVVSLSIEMGKKGENNDKLSAGIPRHRLCLVFPLAFVAKTLPLPCDSTGML